MAHALLSPSAAHRWTRCPGSVVLEKDMPESSSAYADEGTQAHEIAAQMLRREPFHNTDLLSDDLWEAVKAYVERIRELANGADLFRIEQKVDFSSVIGAPDSFGTVDVLIINGDALEIHDLKTGRGVEVSAEENEQLMLYALGALTEYGMVFDIQTVTMVIHQDRIGNVSTWSLSVSELDERAKAFRLCADQVDEAFGAVRKSNSLDGHLFPGEKQCRFCKAKASCPAIAEKVTETVQGMFDDVEAAAAAVATHDGERIAGYLAEVDLIEGWCKAVRERGYELLAANEPVPGYKLVAGKRGARKWSDDAVAEATLKSMRLKVEEMYDLKLISPTTAEKLHKAGTIGPRQWPKLKDIITQPDGKPHVAPESDNRPAITITARAEDFEIV